MLAAGIALIVWAGSRKWNTGLLAGYLFLVLAVTVLSRRAGPTMTYKLIPFWSYRVPSLRREIFLNVVMFIPVGLLGRTWKIIPVSAFFSTVIELSQLVSHRGLFEFDDIIHNTLGAAIGYLIVVGIRKLYTVIKKNNVGVNHAE